MEKTEKLYINDKEASARYSYSRKWFQRARWAGDGPKYVKVRGKVLYPLKETDAWFANHGLRQSTSQEMEVKNE
jgi:predicted DNA-binding transcriptional regulator AlpA